MGDTAVAAVRLWQISDCHCYPDDGQCLEWTEAPIYPNQSLQAVLAHLSGQQAGHSALIISGDLAQEETAATYQRINQLLDTFPLPVYALPGNHDIPALMQQHLGGNTRLPEHIVFGAWHGLLLDTSTPQRPDGELTPAQLQRLEWQLQQLGATDFAIIFMHHHPIDINSAWMDRMGLQQRERFWALLAAFPQVKAVFNGHIHQAFTGQYTFPDGRNVPVFGTPATCVQLKPVNPVFAFDHNRPAWREITLFPDGTLATAVHYLTLPE